MLLIFAFFLFWQTNADDCGLNTESDYHQCQCKLTGPFVDLECKNRDWEKIPSIENLQNNRDGSVLSIRSLKITDENIDNVYQDAFKSPSIQTLHLNCKIHNLNVNAFRGLEDSLHTLDLQKNRLHDFPYWAFTYLRQLQTLNLRNNQIQIIPANFTKETKLNSLRYLHLDGNEISKLNSGSLSDLQLIALTLSDNVIEELATNSLPLTLNVIDLSRNQLESIPYAALFNQTLLANLDLSQNRIEVIRASQNVRFKGNIKLNLAGNKIAQIEENAFASFEKLEELNLDMNKIEKLSDGSFAYVEVLEKLSLRYNRLSNIPAKTFRQLGKSLKQLILAHNEFAAFPSALVDLHSLEHFDVQNNKLQSLNNSFIANFKKTLKRLNVEHNQLVDLDANIFEGMQRLEYLDVSYNQIQRLSKMAFGSNGGAASSLQFVNLAGNHIEEISDSSTFLYVTALHTLNLGFNYIQRISPEALSKLSTLKVLNLEVSISLSSLPLQQNRISVFPKSAFFNLRKLMVLRLDGNQVEDLPVRAFELTPQLIEAHMSRNNIRFLNDQIFHSSSCQQMEWLSLTNNRIEEIGSNAFDSIPKLFHIDLSGNRLKHVNPQTFNTMPALKHLNLENNEIETLHDLAFNQLPMLSALSLSRNRIKRISRPFQNVTRLQHLYFAHNELSSFDFQFLHNKVDKLAILDLSFNKISEIELNSARHSLTTLMLKHNEFEFVDNLMFASADKLQYLDLSLNNIMEIHVDAFAKASHLRQIDLAGNNLKSLWRETFTHQEFLDILDLSFNYITDLETGVFGRDNVRDLVLSRNNLSSVPTKALSSLRNSLKVLDLSDNCIRSLNSPDFVGLEALQRLIFANNKIEVIEANAFEGLKRLRYLDLSGNPITTWSPHALRGIGPQLESLNLALTGIFSVPKFVTKSLKTLNVSQNKIYEIHGSDTEHLSSLNTLDLSHNNIRDIHSNALQNMPKLKHLNLSGNAFTRLDAEHFYNLTELEELRVAEMPNLVRLPASIIFSQLSQLQHLHLYKLPKITNYNITEMLMALPPLSSLHCQIDSYTIGSQFSSADFRHLNTLIVYGRELKMIDPAFFNGIRRYHFHFGIRNTSVSELSAHFFDQMHGIRILELDLAENQFETFEAFRYGGIPFLNKHGTVMESLSLKDNPLICDCRMKWISQWITYAVQNTKTWRKIRSGLAQSLCTNRRKSADNLLNIYDSSSRHHSAETIQNTEMAKIRPLRPQSDGISAPLECQMKSPIGFVSLFSAATNIYKPLWWSLLISILLLG